MNGAFGTLATLSQQPKLKKTSAILVYGYVHILWTYQGAKKNCWFLDDFRPDCVALKR